jgi:spore coat protein H
MNHHVFPTYRISIEPKWLKELQSNIWDEKPVPSKMEVDKLPYEIGITYRGDHIRKFRKKSFRIELGTYSHYFEGREIHLNAEYRDPSLMRSKLSFDFFQTTGTFSPDCKHVFLELNGKPKGIYLQLESVDDLFLQKRQLPNGPIFYATNYQANFSLLNPKREP